MHFRFHTALLTAAFEASHAGTITRDDVKATIACTDDPNCETCQQCEQVTLSALYDAGKLTAEQKANPKAINWATLIAEIIAIIQVIMQLINPPKPTPTPTPSLPAGNGG